MKDSQKLLLFCKLFQKGLINTFHSTNSCYLYEAIFCEVGMANSEFMSHFGTGAQ